MSMAFLASIRARSCGVETMTTPSICGLLEQRNVDIAGAGRQVDDEDVETAPIGFAQQLAQGRGGHGAAPDHGLVGSQHGADRHDLEPEGVVGRENAVVADGGLAFDAQELGDGGAIKIGIEHADAQALGLQRQGDIDGGGGLADAALARADGDDVLDAGNGGFGRRTGAALGRGLTGGRGLVGGQRHHDLAAGGDGFGGALGGLAGGAEGGFHAGSDGDGEGHGAWW